MTESGAVVELSDEEFEAFLEGAIAEYNDKQARLRAAGVGAASRWSFDQASEPLSFFDGADQLLLKADVLEVGSYAPKSGTWMWGWSNSSLTASLRERALP